MANAECREAGSIMNIDQVKEPSDQIELETADHSGDIEDDREVATKRQNDLTQSDERTGYLEESTKIDQAKESGDLDEFKKKEDNLNKFKNTELDQSTGSGNGERELKKDDSLGDGHFSSDIKEWQELSSESEEVKNREDFTQLINSTAEVIFDQREEHNSAFVPDIKDFGEKIYKFIHERKADFKKEQHGAKKISLIKWLKGSVKSDQHLELIQAVKAQVVGLATNISSLLSTLMFSMLGNEKMKAKLPVLGFSINWVTEDWDSVVTSAIVPLEKMIFQEVTRKVEKGKSIISGSAPIDLTSFKEFYQLILLFLDGIKFLDNILMLQREPDSDESVEDSLCSLKAKLTEFEKAYQEKVESGIREIYELKELYADDLEDVTIHHGMRWKINELWNQVWKSEEDELN